ncbi:type II toxin-antitoxin system VapC family toxin [Paraburkholderia bannensis]|uniref:type II toxin-antitoxin system VapC family toxin n=1 Tax=Paraburkholderia bannensis TaxID=765414 RepID=UPI0004887B36|nr:type II toxin-antitoxin system VapC family toxin [Paraburkholderia bannensis]
MNVLVDSSVWVDHFRHCNATLVELMAWDRALSHPLVVAELACGTPPAPRERTLSDIGLLQAANQISLQEVVAFIDREKLYGLGCGLIDLMLLGSVLITPGSQLWTLDKRLFALAGRFDVAYASPMH